MIKKFFFLLFIALFSSSCSGYVKIKKYDEDKEVIDSKIAELKKEKYEMKMKLDMMNNRLLIVENQLIKLKKKLNELIVEKKEKSDADIETVLTKEEIIKINQLSKKEEDEEPIVLTNSMLGKHHNKNIKSSKKHIKSSKNILKKIKYEYKKALALHRAGKYDESIEAFNKLIKKYSKTRNSLTDNFYYWLGENYLSLNDIPLARKNFNIVIQKFPKANKVPDSMFKLGFILEQEGRSNLAVNKYYKKIIKKYADTEAGKLAEERLKKIKNKEE